MNKQLHHQIIDNITKAIGDACETETDVIKKVIDYVDQTARESIEPGVELVDSLAKIFKDTLGHAISLKCSLKGIVKGLIIGAFRSSPTVQQEAHKTIRHMILLTVRDVYALKANVREAMQGALEGIAESAVEEGLNLEAALNEAARDAVDAATELAEDYGDEVRAAVSCEVKGVKIMLPGK
jgi:hypothetical protein